MNSNVVNKPNHMRWLEALRGIACLSVVAEHYLNPKTTYFSFGNFGVIVFFIISGYIVTATTVNKKNETVLSFLMLRIGRLYPVYIVSVLLSFMIYPASWYELIGNLTMFQRFLGIRDINGVYWTLQIEWVFYAVIAICLVFSGVSAQKLKIYFLLFVSITVAFGIIRYYFGVKAPSAMPIGISVILISSIFVTEKEIKPRVIYGTIFVFFIIILSSFLSYSRDWGYNENPYRFIISDIFAISLFLILKIISFRSDFLEFMGKISFSLYLFHQPCSLLVRKFITDDYIFSISISFVFSVVLSYIMFKLIEEPINRRVKTFVKKRMTRDIEIQYN